MLKKRRKAGQVLLITIMLIAVLLTVVLSVSFVSKTETQLTKLEEENQKALAAAEAGIEAALKQGSVAISDILVGSGFTGSADVSTSPSPDFITPLIQKDQQYTFYLSAPAGPADNPDFSSFYDTATPQYNDRALTVCSTSSSFALELTFVKQGGLIKRYVINPPNPPEIVSGASSANEQGTCPSGEDFSQGYNTG